MNQPHPLRLGSILALISSSMWGMLPLFWKHLHVVRSEIILAHRIVWSALFFMLIVMIRERGLHHIPKALKTASRHYKLIGVSAILISLNWLIYIYAVNHGHTLEGSLGYFILPLLNVLLGFVFLGERLNPLQWIAVGLAGCGVLAMTVGQHAFPFYGVALALTFGLYGLCRKKLRLDPLIGSLFEACMISIPAALFLFYQWSVAPTFTIEVPTNLWIPLVLSGAVTAFPLWIFTEAAQRLPLSVLGFISFLAPTLQFLIALFAFNETFTPVHAVSFALIWTGLVVFMYSTYTLSLKPKKITTAQFS